LIPVIGLTLSFYRWLRIRRAGSPRSVHPNDTT
jgi:hypothetical protein